MVDWASSPRALCRGNADRTSRELGVLGFRRPVVLYLWGLAGGFGAGAAAITDAGTGILLVCPEAGIIGCFEWLTRHMQ